MGIVGNAKSHDQAGSGVRDWVLQNSFKAYSIKLNTSVCYSQESLRSITLTLSVGFRVSLSYQLNRTLRDGGWEGRGLVCGSLVCGSGRR